MQMSYYQNGEVSMACCSQGGTTIQLLRLELKKTALIDGKNIKSTQGFVRRLFLRLPIAQALGKAAFNCYNPYS
jgi:hypothetical protein